LLALSLLMLLLATGLAAHESWRVLTAHLVHLGWAHTIMNLAALWLIAWLFGRLFSPRNWLWLGMATALGISAGLWWFSPEIDWYVGISGVLHGFTMAAAIILVAHRIAAGYLVLLMVGGKIFWEQASGALPMTAMTSGGAVVVDSHLYGALVGALVSIAIVLNDRRSGADAGGHPS
jgi:rhomboid family GlyGly-CTERM serine protease